MKPNEEPAAKKTPSKDSGEHALPPDDSTTGTSNMIVPVDTFMQNLEEKIDELQHDRTTFLNRLAGDKKRPYGEEDEDLSLFASGSESDDDSEAMMSDH